MGHSNKFRNILYTRITYTSLGKHIQRTIKQ